MIRHALALLLLAGSLFPLVSAQTPYCVPGAPNSYSAGGAVLSCAANWGTANATFDVVDIPNQPGILFGGTAAVDLPFGCGRRCVGGNVVRGYYTFPSTNALLGEYFDMSVPGVQYVQWWYRDPANFGACGRGFNLSNAVCP